MADCADTAAQGNEPVLWHFVWEATEYIDEANRKYHTPKCLHVNFISDLTDITIREAGEQEYLLPPYSVCTVDNATLREGRSSADHPHMIWIKVKNDNKRKGMRTNARAGAEWEDLPVAPYG